MIIGTAGHVDHGKTSLIKALTGMDTDRLQEEKKRGITIELGFANMGTPFGKVGIIDVPGHEKFIKNMLAGAGSIDIALLVIAADEGMMPQTREHLDILKMLQINRGVIALNKADLVEDEWLEMMTMEIEEKMQGTFMEDAKIIPVSAHTGVGVDELQGHIFELLELCNPVRDMKALGCTVENFRLPIDRVFTMDGFGTVVTGTLLEGTLREGDDITIFPSLKTTKARFLQAFGESAPFANPGQRVAVNLAQVKNEDITRGDVLARSNSIENSYILDVRLDILPDTEREILNNSRVHLYHGTRDLLCRISLVAPKKKLASGESGYAKLHLAEPLAAKCGDPFVIRFYSPLITVGGGVILDPNPVKARSSKEDSFKKKDIGSLGDKIEVFVSERFFPDSAYIKERFFHNHLEFDAELNRLIGEKFLFCAGGKIVHRDFVARQGSKMQEILLDYHKKNPLHKGMAVSELSSQLFSKKEQAYFGNIVNFCCTLGYIKKIENLITHKDFNVMVNEKQQQITNEILQKFHDGGFAPPGVDELEEAYIRDKTVLKQVLDNLILEGKLILLTPQIFIHYEFFEKAKNIFIDEATKKGEVTLGQFRDILGTSRKYAVALLENFDKKKISKKVGDVRML